MRLIVPLTPPLMAILKTSMEKRFPTKMLAEMRVIKSRIPGAEETHLFGKAFRMMCTGVLSSLELTKFSWVELKLDPVSEAHCTLQLIVAIFRSHKIKIQLSLNRQNVNDLPETLHYVITVK